MGVRSIAEGKLLATLGVLFVLIIGSSPNVTVYNQMVRVEVTRGTNGSSAEPSCIRSADVVAATGVVGAVGESPEGCKRAMTFALLEMWE